MKHTERWSRVMLGMEAPKHEVARFASTGDAYTYAKTLVGREGVANNIWLIPPSGIPERVRCPAPEYRSVPGEQI